MAKAIRPIFIPTEEGDKIVDIKNIEFEWHMGMALSQKKKSMNSLHEKAKELGIFPVLEISSRSDDVIGKKLSAFNLLFEMGNKKISVESVFQGSKIFEKGGPFRDLYFIPGWEIKKDVRLKESGKFIGFNLNNEDWPIEPKTLFYDWIYMTALIQNPDLSKELFKYKGFSDIAFNPKKSFSCQAYSAALFISLQKRGLVPKIFKDKKSFFDAINKYDKIKTDTKQKKLF